MKTLARYANYSFETFDLPTDILDSPTVGAAIKTRAKAGEHFTAIRVETHAEEQWVKVKTASGVVGFIHHDTLVLLRGGHPSTVSSERPRASLTLRQAFVLLWRPGTATITSIVIMVLGGILTVSNRLGSFAYAIGFCGLIGAGLLTSIIALFYIAFVMVVWYRAKSLSKLSPPKSVASSVASPPIKLASSEDAFKSYGPSIHPPELPLIVNRESTAPPGDNESSYMPNQKTEGVNTPADRVPPSPPPPTPKNADVCFDSKRVFMPQLTANVLLGYAVICLIGLADFLAHIVWFGMEQFRVYFTSTAVIIAAVFSFFVNARLKGILRGS
jgi:hypothetical protein